MKAKGMYLVNLYGGYCGLMEARSIASARRAALAEHGTRNFESVRRATKEDIAHVAGMGGYVNRVSAKVEE